jgi:hypothetical protein
VKILAVLSVGLLLASILLVSSASSVTSVAHASSTQTVSRVITIPAAPQSSFAGAAGGDGFNAAVADGRVYSVYHHQAQLQASCLLQSTGAPCGDGWPHTSALSDGVGTPMSSYAFVADDGDTLYAYALRSDLTAGVVCISLPVPASCGFTALTVVSGASIPVQGEDGHGAGAPYSIDFGAPARVGDRIYAPFASADRVWLTCFDLSTGAQCTGAPFELSGTGAGWQQDTYLRGPRAVAYGDRVYVTLHEGTDTPSSTLLTCWDPATQRTCGDPATATWPVAVATPWGLLPVLSTDGTVAAVCLTQIAATRCVNAISGAATSAPAVLSSFEPENGDSGAFFGQARMIGTRMVFISSTSTANPRFTCIDFGSAPAAWCGDFAPTNAALVYAVDDDPDRAGCLWFNSDNGSGQIQSFDMLTMASGCSEQGRIARPQIAPDIDSCPVYTWNSVQVLAPEMWETGSVDVRTTEGERALPGGSMLPLVDSATPTSLADVDVSAENSPLFVFSFTGASLTDGVTARFTWVTDGSDVCLTGSAPEVSPAPPTSLAATGTDPRVPVALGIALWLAGCVLVVMARATERRRHGRTASP